ncbi:MAG TPA: MFS transporter [Bryobacteraceae bacterium]|nr:MFS transporter [Bryobacteraceae bacterium]
MRGSYRWWVVAMLWFVCLFNYADRQAIFSVFPLLKKEMNLSDVQLGIVAGAFMWVYAISGPLAGLIGDRLNRKALILSGLIFWSLVTIATALSTTYWHLVLFRALEGLGEAFYFPASMSLISDYHGRETRSRAMALHQSSVYAGTIVGGAVAGYLAQLYGWRSGFYLFGSLGVVLGLVLMLFLREPARGQAEAEAPAAFSGGLRESLAGVFESRMSPVLIAVFVGANFVASIFLTWMPSFLYRKFGMSLAMAGLNATAYLQIASVLGVISGGVLADRLIRKHRGGRMMTQAIGLFLGVPFVFLTGWTTAVPVLVLAMAGFGYFKGMYDANIWASLYDVVKPAHRATALGLMNSIGWLGGGVAPVAIAYASERYGMSAAISANSVVYLLFGCLMVFGIRRFMRGTPAGKESHRIDGVLKAEQ